MNRLQTISLLLGLLVGSSLSVLAQERYAIRVYKVGEKLFTRDSAGSTPTTSPYAITSVDATNDRIQLTIGKLVRYYTPSKFLDANGSPWGSTVIDAVTAFQTLANPGAIVGGGSGGSVTDASQILTGTLSESRLPATVIKTTGTYSNPSWLTGIDATKITESTTRRFLSDSKIGQYDAYSSQISSAATTATNAQTAANSATTTIATKAPLTSPTFTGTVTVPAPATSDSSTKAATTKYVRDNIQTAIDRAVQIAVKRALDSVSLSFATNFNANQFYNDPTLGVSITGYPFSGTGTGGSSSTVVSGTGVTGTAIEFTNAEANFPITLFPGPPRYYQGTVGTDWGSGGNTGLATTKLPSNGSGWIAFQYTGNTQLAIGFDSLNVLQSGGYSAMRVGVFIYNNTVGVVKDGVLVNTTQVALAGSSVRVRREITGGVASYFVEYSANGTSWANITPAPTAPATKFFTLNTMGDLFARVAINSDFILVSPVSSTNFVAR